MHLKLLVSPLTKGAYFAEYLEVSLAELNALIDGIEPKVERIGQLDFIEVEVEEEHLPTLARASFVHGIFEVDGGHLVPLPISPNFLLSEDLVYGVKYKGKTNELVTQLAINLARRYSVGDSKPKTLLDPMAGKGTTLLWALRYGMKSRGIEADRGALEDLHRHLKKQTKLHRIKHVHSEGYHGKKNRQQHGRFFHYEMADQTLRLIIGDTRNTEALLSGQRFNTLVADLPYGIQFKGDDERRDPIETLRECGAAWVDSVRPGGAIVLIFNRYQPKRAALVEVFTALGCKEEAFEAPHRMSESIVRDLVVFTRPT